MKIKVIIEDDIGTVINSTEMSSHELSEDSMFDLLPQHYYSAEQATMKCDGCSKDCHKHRMSSDELGMICDECEADGFSLKQESMETYMSNKLMHA